MSNDQASLTDYGSGDPRRERYVSRLTRFCDDVLPEQAQSSDGAWPVWFDHCFRRLVYDAACGREWTDVIDRPFIDNAPFARLQRATCYAVRMHHDGPAYAERLQEKSLLWRGKMAPEEATVIDPDHLQHLP